MIEDFMYVLENYPNVDLTKESDRRLVAESLVNYMCSRHIITYTDLDGAMRDPDMVKFIESCKCDDNVDDTDSVPSYGRGL